MSKVKIGSCLGHNDHKEIQFIISIDRRKSASKTSALDMRRTDFRLFRELVSEVPWENTFCRYWGPSVTFKTSSPKSTGPGNSQTSEIKQVRQKGVLAEQNLLLETRDKGRYIAQVKVT